MVPGVQDLMEGCPADSGLNLLYLVLTGSIAVFLFGIHLAIQSMRKQSQTASANAKKELLYDDTEFQELQLELYGAKNLRRLQHLDTGVTNSMHSGPLKSSKHGKYSASSSDTSSKDGTKEIVEIEV
jgi:hypothetical protein